MGQTFIPTAGPIRHVTETISKVQTSRTQLGGRGSKGVEHLSLLHAGVKGLPEHEGVQPRPQFLRQGHDDVQVPLHVQVQVRLQAAQGLERLLPLLPARRGRGRGRGRGEGFHVGSTDESRYAGGAQEFSILCFLFFSASR